MVCAVPRKKTHDITFDSRRLCYRWHRWYDQDILTRPAGGARADATYFCKLPEASLHEMLVEIPRWMFDAAECASMRVMDMPHVDCQTLRALKNAVAEQSASLKAAVLKPQLSRQAGDGDIDGNDIQHTSNHATNAVQRTPARSGMERSRRAHANRGGPIAGATDDQLSRKQSQSNSSKPGRAR